MSSLSKKFLVYLGKFTLLFLMGEMTVLGLFSYRVDYVTRHAISCPIRFIHCAIMGICCTTTFTYICLSFAADPELQHYYDGVTYLAILMSNIICAVMILVFYGTQLINRKSYMNFLNQLTKDYETFGLFYNNQIHLNYRDLVCLSNLREIAHVYIPLFWKSVVCHFTVLTLISYMCYSFSKDISVSNAIGLLIFQGLPYLVQSATSSYLFLGAKKMSFLNVELEGKLEAIQRELKLLIITKNVSQHAKMKRFCELSEEVDSLCASFQTIICSGRNITKLYAIHILLILGYYVFISLTQLFMLYMSTTSYLRGNSAFFDFSAAMASIGFLTINVLEVLLVVNAVDQSESICRKVVKRVHIINYWQRHFDNRLKQSVSAEGLLTSDQSDWIFFTCSWSYFLISQQGISSKLWWCR